jgi:hypothetical protein
VNSGVIPLRLAPHEFATSDLPPISVMQMLGMFGLLRAKNHLDSCWRRYVLLLCLVTASACAQKTDDPPWRNLQSISAFPFYRHTVNDVITLNIPEGNVDRWVMGYSGKSPYRHVYIHGVTAHFLPESPETIALFSHPNNLRYEISAKIHSGAVETPDQTARLLNHSATFLASTFQADCQPQKAATIFGLDKYGFSVDKCASVKPVNYDFKDIYVPNQEPFESARTAIACSGKNIPDIDDPKREFEFHILPYCQHHTVVPALNSLVTIRYGRAFLKDWQKIEVRVLEIFMPRNPVQ